MQTTVKRPRKIDGRRARGTQFSGGGFDAVACGSSKRESVSTGDADKGGATHLEPADRFGDEPVVVYLDPALFVWEQGLIQKPHLTLRQPLYRHERFIRRVSRLRGHKKNFSRWRSPRSHSHLSPTIRGRSWHRSPKIRVGCRASKGRSLHRSG